MGKTVAYWTLGSIMIASLLVLGSLLAVGTAPPHAGAQGAGEDSCTFEETPDLGLACRLENGVWKIQHEGGRIGYTHGPDPVPDPHDGPEGSTHGGKRPPVCAQDPDTDYHHVAIYARASDDSDRYASIAPQLEEIVHRVNGHLNQEAQNEGAFFADYRFHCTGGDVTIHNEALPTSKADADFNTIINDLLAKGYDNHRVKYWVWYDDQDACSCAGIGHIYYDDRLIADNWNNGHSNAIPMFGITFGYLSSQGHRTMMHENGHNMGAVQLSAPNASPGGGHCNDGQDIMCYDDSGSLPSKYNPNVCSGYERFDCNKDDYFTPLPDASSYLSDHWNLGSQLNRFLVLAVPFEVTATPTQQTYSANQQPVLEIRVESTAGEPIHEADVQIEARYETSVGGLDALLHEHAPCATQWSESGQTNRGDLRIRAPTLSDRCLPFGPTAELVTAPDGRWHVEVTVTKYGEEETVVTTYEVGP